MACYTGCESFTNDELLRRIAEKETSLPPEVQELLTRVDLINEPKTPMSPELQLQY